MKNWTIAMVAVLGIGCYDSYAEVGDLPTGEGDEPIACSPDGATMCATDILTLSCVDGVWEPGDCPPGTRCVLVGEPCR